MTVLSVVDWVLMAVGTVLTSVVVTLVGWLVVNVLAVSILVVVSLMGDHGVVFVTDWTGVGLVLELDVRLLLVVFLVVRVEVSGHFVVDGVLMNNLGVVVVLVVSHALDEVVRLFVDEVFTVVSVVVVTMAVVVVEASLVVSVVVVFVMGNGLMDRLVSSLVVGVVVVVVMGDRLVDRLVDGQVVTRDFVLHLSAKEDLGESETDGVTILVEVLVLPLCLGVHDFVVDILSVHNEVVLNMEDEVPRVSESLGHLTELIEISANGGLALLELVSDIVDDMTEILNSVKHGVEGTVLELVLNTTETLPDVLGITEALDTVRNLSLDGTGKETLENLAHTEEGEVHVGALHGLEVVHLLILLVIDLIKELLPMVIEIVEELFVVDHLGLSVKEHGGCLTEVLTSVEPLAHTVIVETLTSVLENVDTVDDERLGGLEEDLLGVEVSLSHSLDLLVIVMINLTAVVKHVTNVRHGQTELVDGLGGLLVRSVPEAAHGVLEVLLNRVGVGDAVTNIGHAVEVEGTNEETFNEAGDLGIVMGVVSDS